MENNRETINITGLDKAAVLAALFNASKQQGMGFLHTEGAAGNDMSVETARELIDHMIATGYRSLSYDYLRGRVMKINISTDELDPWGYDRDNGKGAAFRALLAAGLV